MAVSSKHILEARSFRRRGFGRQSGRLGAKEGADGSAGSSVSHEIPPALAPLAPHKTSEFRLITSATGTRTRVARVRAEYPNQLDYSGFVWCSKKCQIRFYAHAAHSRMMPRSVARVTAARPTRECGCLRCLEKRPNVSARPRGCAAMSAEAISRGSFRRCLCVEEHLVSTQVGLKVITWATSKESIV